jgi:hypothetical protein
MEKPSELPKYRGWTVDFRLGEFRRVKNPRSSKKRELETMGFRSIDGDILLGQLITSRAHPKLGKEALEWAVHNL